MVLSDLNANETCLECGAPIEDEYPIEGEEYTCPKCGTKHLYVWDSDSDGLTVERS